jgi:hypothetical protein
MKKLLISALITAMSALAISPASAHQPVVLLDTDTTAEKGPLLVDGTISFAIRASFTKSGQKKAFRAALKEGDQLDVQYLIIDKKPENTLKNTLLPQLVITSPTGTKTTIKFTERTKFYEPWGRTNYLYLARISTPAEAGIYSFVATSRAKSAITIAVGEKEVTGEVLRGPAPAPIPAASAKPAPTPAATASPTPEVTTASVYTMAKVKENNSATSCWSVINGKVYDLTKWINSHPGGSSAIKGLCGIDGTSSFTAQHRGQGSPASTLAGYLLGPLTS